MRGFRPLAAGALSAIAGAGVWAASPYITGEAEPWDSESAYYLAALAAIGVVAAFFTRRFIAVYAGTFVGQAAFMLLTRPPSPFAPLGVAFLAASSLVTLAFVAVPALLRASAASR